MTDWRRLDELLRDPDVEGKRFASEDEIAEIVGQAREELEDALLGYFGGGYPRGSCASRQEAETTLWAAIERARERELEELRETASSS